jgi:hypothetical protein
MGNPKTDVRHKMAVHHIHVKHAATGRFHLGHVFAQASKIRRKNRGKYFNHGFALRLSQQRKTRPLNPARKSGLRSQNAQPSTIFSFSSLSSEHVA